MPFVIPDGLAVANNSGGGSVAAVLTTTNANDLIVVDVMSNAGPIVSVVASGGNSASAGLSPFQPHAAAPESGAAQDTVERWSATAQQALSGVTITVNPSSVGTFTTMVAYGVTGANLVSPWDPGGPVVNHGPFPSPGADPISITTQNPITVVIAAWTEGQTTTGHGAGFTTITDNNFLLSEYQILSSAQTLSCTTGTATSSKGGIADAIVPSTASLFGGTRVVNM